MSKPLVANELLAFLQQKLDVMNKVSAIQICKSSFSEAEVAAVKKLLYESLDKLDEMMSRPRDGTPKSLQDIVTKSKSKYMAPTKFGLFKARSRDQAEQPSTENLLQSNSSDLATPGSPIPSTSKGVIEDLTPEDISDLHIDSEEDETPDKRTPIKRRSQVEDSQINYHPLRNRPSIDATSTSTLQDDQPQYEDMQSFNFELDNDGASTSADCNSIQMDDMSVAPSEDISVYCGALKKPKKMRSREEQQLRDLDMWQATNVEVMQNLLSRSGTLDEQIKWEAIATSRGLCTLTDSCTCADCKRTKYLAGITDGDGGLGAAPLFSAISVGCVVQ